MDEATEPVHCAKSPQGAKIKEIPWAYWKHISRFGEDVEGELAEIIKPSSEINNGSLSKMGFTKIGGKWVSKDGDQVGPSGNNDEDEAAEPALLLMLDLALMMGEKESPQWHPLKDLCSTGWIALLNNKTISMRCAKTDFSNLIRTSRV